MNRKRLVLFVIALIAMALPTRMLADVLDSVPKMGSKKVLPYPKATKAIPASQMEYDSITGCFVVRDTIVGAAKLTRSVSEPKEEIKAVSTKPEGGVLYGYFGNQLSSNNMAEMKQIVESWTTSISNIDIDGILSPAPEKETWYMQIVGVNNSTIDSKNGEMRIYNDIGTTYNYKTIAIDSMGLRNNEHIQKVVFEDCASASENANTSLRMVIHNGAFKDCKNLKEFNMYYLVTDGTNHYQMIYPWDIYIGDNVFDGCHEDFRIVVAPPLYNLFLADDNWGKYADKIVASDYMPTTEKPIVFEGVTYDYAAKSLNTLPTSELTRLQSSWWNAAIIGVEVAITIASFGIPSSAQAAAIASAQGDLKAAITTLTASETTLKELIKNAAHHITINAARKAHKLALSGYEAASKALLDVMAKEFLTQTYTLAAAGISAGSVAGANALGYITNTTTQKAKRQKTWELEGQWLLTENKHTIYHMYVKDVEI